MTGKRVLSYLGVASFAIAGAVGVATTFEGTLLAQAPPPAAGRGTATGGAAQAPRATAPAAGTATPVYRVQALWPQPLPYQWALGAVSGVTVDSKDNIWVLTKGPASFRPDEIPMIAATPSSRVCCLPAPSVLQFDANGRLVSSFGGPTIGYTWPQNTGGIAVDGAGNVWVTAYGLDAAPAGGRGRGAAPAGAPAVATPPATTAPPAGGAPPADGAGRGGRGGRGAGAPGAAPGAAAGGAPPAGGAAAGGRGGRGGRGGDAAAGGAAPAAPAAAAPAAQAPAAPAGRGAAPAAAPVVADAHVLKYSHSGQVMLTIGTPGSPGGGEKQLNRPAGVTVDDAANEVYIADSGNHRIVVFDSNTGAFKRQWGGSGQAPTAAGGGAYDPNAAPSPQFRDPSCVKIAKDGTVYVCDRTSNRIQVFQKNGTFVKEMIIAKDTGSASAAVGSIVLVSGGSVWDIAFSNDATQRFLYVADGANKKIRILRRDTLAEVGVIGGGGRWPGRFLTPSTVAVDSRGNLYTGEAYHSKRVQKFVR